MKHSSIVRSVVIALAAAACATAPPTGVPARDRNVIARGDIDVAKYNTAYDVVFHLRPVWLDPPTKGSLVRFPWVYLEGMLPGNAVNLRDIPAGAIEEIRYLTPDAVLIRWGAVHPAGAIEIRTIGGKRIDLP